MFPSWIQDPLTFQKSLEFHLASHATYSILLSTHTEKYVCFKSALGFNISPLIYVISFPKYLILFNGVVIKVLWSISKYYLLGTGMLAGISFHDSN